MTAMLSDDDLDDLLPDDLLPETPSRGKGAAVPVVRSAKSQAAAEKRAAEQARKDELKAQAARLAQIVNLHIAGYSLAEIGASIGATAEEVDRLLSADTARYIRSQPALRTYVRNWVSAKYMKMIEADWEAASDENRSDKLEHQDRVMRMLDRMAKLHGAEAPTQAEVKVEAAPETVDALVAKIAASQGMGYDVSIFDTVPGTVIHSGAEAATKALEVSGNRIDEMAEEETDDDGFA